MKLKFYTHPKKTEIIWANKLEQVFNQVDTKWKNKLVPLISFEMNILNDNFPNIPVHVFHHSVGMDKIIFKVENNKYDLIEFVGKLGKIEDFDAKVFKSAFLTTDFNPEFDIEGTYYYDNQ